MNPKISKLIERLKSDKKILAIMLVGILSVILLSLSEFIPEEKEDPLLNDTSSDRLTFDYEAKLEERLTELIEYVDGAGKTKVMLTIDCSDESVYATETVSNNGRNETKFVLAEDDGNDSGVLLKVWMPEIRGVAVVCQGADSAKVREEITGVVTAVLGISTNRINISKMNNNSGG